MRSVSIIVLALILLTSCKKTEPAKELTVVEKQEMASQWAEWELSDQHEKISLLASIKGMRYDSLYSVIKKYYSKMHAVRFEEDKIAIASDIAIGQISEMSKLSRSQVASLIYSFKYQMITEEEVIKDLQREAELENEMMGEAEGRY